MKAGSGGLLAQPVIMNYIYQLTMGLSGTLETDPIPRVGWLVARKAQRPQCQLVFFIKKKYNINKKIIYIDFKFKFKFRIKKYNE